MVQSLPSPPPSRSASPVPGQRDPSEEEQLIVRLDNLLEQYLELLDSYTKLRDGLSSQFSEGFFALARAQRAANIGAGRRYGQDGYDSRMKALRRVDIKQSSESRDAALSTSFRCQIYKEPLEGNPIKPVHEHSDPKNSSSISTSAEKQVGGDQSVKKHSKAYRDPATWYSLLVPAPLRDTQSHFIRAAEHSIPTLLATKSSMENLEQQIWETRAALGIADQYIQTQQKEEGMPDALAEIDQLLVRARARP